MEMKRELNKNEANDVYGYQTTEHLSSKKYTYMKTGQNESTPKCQF